MIRLTVSRNTLLRMVPRMPLPLVGFLETLKAGELRGEQFGDKGHLAVLEGLQNSWV
ncbi:hypothetical protein [Microcoleus sp. FACHB-672]|uniref:hypothetical protein n=1 Tax=Microcoleus sp. FACHB-672 TaxID=2692825 RepID=UPI00168573DE|nr:hypothetical protein [Microcoleus sp. FACHB-672]MBD2039975.1 hypothetical protein [Microcoleus sp. FACHB-672]